MTGVLSPFNEALIEAYKKCIPLYDVESPGYKVQAPTKECWESVAEASNATISECRVRWKALRDRYIKELKKMRGPNGHNRKPWIFFEKMSFLNPYIEKQRLKFPKSASRHKGDFNAESVTNNHQDNGLFSNMNMHEMEYSNGSSIVKRSELFSTNFQLLKACAESEDNCNLHNDDELNLRLIHTVKQHDALFNMSNPRFNCQKSQQHIWEKIAKEFDDGIYTEKYLRNHWEMLKAKYISEIKLTQDSTTLTGYYSKWPLFDAMKFLDGHLASDSTTKFDMKTIMNPGFNDCLSKYVEQLNKDDCMKIERAETPASGSSSVHSIQTDNSCALNLTKMNRKRKAQKDDFEEAVSYLRDGISSLKRISQTFLEENEETLFGKYVSTVLQNMSEEKRIQTKLEIFSVLHNTIGKKVEQK